MILIDSAIRSRQLIGNDSAEHYRGASYDLTVGDIVGPDGMFVDEHVLIPQGMIKVVSAETVTVPSNTTGYVHVKTGLCNEGVLALNIGIVDPGFSGPLQSTLINFGKATHCVRKGTIFGRITFHEHLEADNPTAVIRSIETVRADARKHVLNYLAPDFLNFSKTVKKAAKKATAEYRNTLLWYAPVLALLLAIFTYLLNFANMSRMEGYLKVDDRVSDVRQQEEMAAQLKELQSDIAKLKDQLGEPRAMHSPVHAPAKKR